MPGTAIRVGRRPRGFVGVRGPDAASYLQAMVSNDVEALGPGESCEALLLTAKGRVIAPLTVYRRAADDYVLLTETELAERVRAALVRSRFAAKVAIELEDHSSVLVVGRETPPGGVANREFGVAAYELLDEETPAWGEIGDEELERLRIRAGTPRYGRELDERVLPAEAGLDRTAIDFEKGCYPGQEPIARQHYRGRVNRTLRVLELEGEELPAYDAELDYEGKVVGRVTSAVRDGENVIGLAYVRVEVPQDAELRVGERLATQLGRVDPQAGDSRGSPRREDP
jgi:tRNA-modifying protein YgfZ